MERNDDQSSDFRIRGKLSTPLAIRTSVITMNGHVSNKQAPFSSFKAGKLV